MDEEQLWDEAGSQQTEAFELLHDGIRWSLESDLRVIVDLHIVRSHHFNSPDSRRLWDDPEAQAKFLDLWKQLSAELHEYPLDSVAYEPLNEAVAEDSEDWNKLINQVIGALRELEPERVIVMGSNRWQTAGTFPDLQIPADDPNACRMCIYVVGVLATHRDVRYTLMSQVTKSEEDHAMRNRHLCVHEHAPQRPPHQSPWALSC